MYDIKKCNTQDMLALIFLGEALGFNRQLDIDLVSADIDHDGTHLLQLVLPFHDRGIADDTPHHRVRCFIKIQGTMTPAEAIIDIPAANWDELPAHDEVMA